MSRRTHAGIARQAAPRVEAPASTETPSEVQPMLPCSLPAELLTPRVRLGVHIVAMNAERLLVDGCAVCRSGDTLQLQVNLPASPEATLLQVKVVSAGGTVDGVTEVAIAGASAEALWALHHVLACVECFPSGAPMPRVRTRAPRVVVRADGMAASADLAAPPAPMGVAAAGRAVEACLRAAGVEHGIQHARILAALQRAVDTGQLQQRVNVAVATPAQPERSPEVRFMFTVGGRDPQLLDADARRKLRESGQLTLDFVRRGDVICLRHPRRAAVVGSDVYGRVLRPGAAVRAERTSVQLGDGVQADAKRQERIVCAVTAGYADFDGRELTVSAPLSISEDGMRAELLVHPPQDAAALPIEMADVDQLLQEAGVVFGVDRPAAAALIAAALASPTVRPPFAIARGRPPVHGDDAQVRSRTRPLEAVIGLGCQRVFRCAVDEMFERVPATTGTEGRTVRGQDVPALDGIDYEFSAGPGVLDEGQGVFSPSLPGVLCAMSGQLQAFPLRRLGPQDGAVTLPEAALEVTAEAAHRPQAECGGPIIADPELRAPHLGTSTHAVLLGGVSADDTGWVRADGCIWVAHASGLELRAGQDLFIASAARDCQLSAGGALRMPDGQLVGGKTYAASGIEVDQLGDVDGTVTDVRVGPRSGHAIGAELDREQQVRMRLQRIFTRIGGRRLSELRPDQRLAFAELVAERDRLKRELQTLAADPERRRRAMRGDGDVVVNGRMHPGVLIRIRNQTFRCTHPTGPCRIAYSRDSGRIVLLKR